ncbi:serine/threonine-protein kinase RIO1-like [Plectropomus leopardus]|uniref:serine/threonine-protein kinase RIO1-like n=1 Tax=Plectropomus leopardus TaxID=160734 RepID=UPI001C4B1CE0|nr:serine/threonine-protein kinase RIO1-like [Plectropomus leopardus]
MQKQKEADTYRVKDKSDRATVEQVLDPRTRMILFKMLSRGIISEINGCISTGKEVRDHLSIQSITLISTLIHTDQYRPDSKQTVDV